MLLVIDVALITESLQGVLVMLLSNFTVGSRFRVSYLSSSRTAISESPTVVLFVHHHRGPSLVRRNNNNVAVFLQALEGFALYAGQPDHLAPTCPAYNKGDSTSVQVKSAWLYAKLWYHQWKLALQSAVHVVVEEERTWQKSLLEFWLYFSPDILFKLYTLHRCPPGTKSRPFWPLVLLPGNSSHVFIWAPDFLWHQLHWWTSLKSSQRNLDPDLPLKLCRNNCSHKATFLLRDIDQTIWTASKICYCWSLDQTVYGCCKTSTWLQVLQVLPLDVICMLCTPLSWSVTRTITKLPTSVVECFFATLPTLEAASVNFRWLYHKLSKDWRWVWCLM